MFWFDDEIYNPIMMNVRELEGGNVEEHVKLIRQRHHEAIDIIRKWKIYATFSSRLILMQEHIGLVELHNTLSTTK